MRLACVVLLVLTGVAHAQVQDLGHRLPAGAGLDSGTQVDAGLYVGNQFVWFGSHEVHDRNGNVVPIPNLDVDAYADAFGVAGTMKLAGLYLGAAASVPLAKLTISTDNPDASVDRLGLGDIFFKPLQIGARFSHADTIASYSAYAPTTQGARTGIGQPQWSHQLSAGGTVFASGRRGWRLSALASYTHNGKKRGVDITRGDSVLIQGGGGGRVLGPLEAGVAGYALWQVTDDSGADLPPVLAGARERAFGLGPEIDVVVPQLRSRFTCRFTWDVDGEARPVGTILVVAVSVLAWR